MSLTDILAAYLAARPLEWIDGRAIATVAGAYAWRTRISQLRRPPHAMTIENRMRTERTAEGRRYTVSEYRYVPAAAEGEQEGPQP